MADELKPCVGPYLEMDCGFCGAHLRFPRDIFETQIQSLKRQMFEDKSAAIARAEAAEQLAEAASSQLLAAVDAFEAAEAKVEKVRVQCALTLAADNRTEYLLGAAAFARSLDAILAPGGGEKE